MALLPFRNPMASDTEYFGGIERTKWIWSTWTLPSNISMCLHSHNWRIMSLTDLPTSPLNILNRYFGHHTTWYLHSHTACDNFLNCFTDYLLLIYRVTTTPILRRYSFYVNLYLTCIAKLGPSAKLMVYAINKINVESKVHTYGQVKTYINKYSPIAVSTCYCRHEAALLGEDTHGSPMEVCMSFGPGAKFCLERLNAREITKIEARSC